MPSCVLKRFEGERPLLKGVSLCPGLAIDRGRLILQEPYFSCCTASGMRFSGQDKESISRCDLIGRLTKIESVIKQFHMQWKLFAEDFQKELTSTGQGLFNLSEKDADFFWKQLLGHRLNGCSKGCYVESPEKEKLKPSRLWWAAFHGAWRLGMNCRVVTMGSDINKTLHKIYEDDKKIGSKNGERSIFFVEKIDKLWDSHSLLDFEVLVNYCYDRKIPMWLEFISREGQVASQDKTSFGFKPVSKRIAALKMKSYKEWIPEGLKMKLKEVSQFRL